tara:strand:- start:15 stop:548 length:534 start_codon:yes stop_codon:yes gene_type:complete
MRHLLNEEGDIWACHACHKHVRKGGKCCGMYIGHGDGYKVEKPKDNSEEAEESTKVEKRKDSSEEATKEPTNVEQRKRSEDELVQDKLSAQSIKVLPQPYAQSKIEDDYYMEKCDQYIHSKLLAVKEPKCIDFERIFNDFEKSYWEEFRKNSSYEMKLEEVAPVHVRMLMALQRYTS